MRSHTHTHQHTHTHTPHTHMHTHHTHQHTHEHTLHTNTHRTHTHAHTPHTHQHTHMSTHCTRTHTQTHTAHTTQPSTLHMYTSLVFDIHRADEVSVGVSPHYAPWGDTLGRHRTLCCAAQWSTCDKTPHHSFMSDLFHLHLLWLCMSMHAFLGCL